MVIDILVSIGEQSNENVDNQDHHEELEEQDSHILTVHLVGLVSIHTGCSRQKVELAQRHAEHVE